MRLSCARPAMTGHVGFDAGFVNEDHTARETGRRLLISAATAVRLAACLRQSGNLTPAVNLRRQGHGRPVPCEGFFAELAEQDPDITLKKLQAALLEAHGVRASLSGIVVVLRRSDLKRFANA